MKQKNPPYFEDDLDGFTQFMPEKIVMRNEDCCIFVARVLPLLTHIFIYDINNLLNHH